MRYPIALVAISGRIGAGKSSIAKALAFVLECEVLSFGKFVRTQANSVGAPETRESLAAVGQSLVDRDCEKFVAEALSFVGWRPGDRLVIDGVRHNRVRSALISNAAHQRFVHLHVHSRRSVRSRRIELRLESRDVASLDRDPTEREVARLATLADVIVRGDGDLDRVVSEILAHPLFRATTHQTGYS